MVFIQIIGQLVCLYLMMNQFAERIDFNSNGGHKYNTDFYHKNKAFYRDSS